MLRVRPVVRTPQAGAWAQLLLALGLTELGNATAGERCFAADSGRILLSTAPAFAIELGFEVRDLEKFARWTRSDGTEVLLRTAEAGPIGHLSATDKLQFTATPVDANVTAGSGPAVAAGSLGVLALWNTPDVPGSAQTLRNIGAQESPGGPGIPGTHFRAGHGGHVQLRSAITPEVELELGIAGDTGELAARLAAAGFETRFAQGAHGRTLLVQHPDGGELRLAQCHLDADGPAPRK